MPCLEFLSVLATCSLAVMAFCQIKNSADEMEIIRKRWTAENMLAIWPTLTGIKDLPHDGNISSPTLSKYMNDLEKLALFRVIEAVDPETFDKIFKENFVAYCNDLAGKQEEGSIYSLKENLESTYYLRKLYYIYTTEELSTKLGLESDKSLISVNE